MIGSSDCGGRVLNRERRRQQQAVGGLFTAPVKRHLMYYVWPRGCWRDVMQAVIDRISLFNGVRCLSIAYNDTKDVAEVTDIYGKYWDHILPCPNIPELRETTAWLPALQHCISDDPNSVIFTAHAKGVTHADRPEVQRWTQAMTEINLDYWPMIEDSLQQSAMCGAFRRTGKFPRTAHNVSDNDALERWHYSGTYYWMRSKDLFARDWRKLDWAWYGVESYPGLQFTKEQCGCLVGDGCADLYNPETWRHLQPEIERWKTSAEMYKRDMNPFSG